MEKEIWMLIPGYEYYYASNFGRVKSLAWGKERILKTHLDRCGYLRVVLGKKQKTVHSLVWVTFNGPVPKGYEINHINEDKTDCSLSNLSLTTKKENCNWGTRNRRISEGLTNGKTSKRVFQFDLDGNFIREWISLAEIRRSLGFCTSDISLCCRGKQASAYNHKWKYADIQ